jgi:hypothetical protein
VAVTGTGFAPGTIDPAKIAVELTTNGSSQVLSAAVTGVTPERGDTRTVRFTLPSLGYRRDVIYSVGISGETADGLRFATGRKTQCTIQPSPENLQ